jgi:hypothetical protein
VSAGVDSVAANVVKLLAALQGLLPTAFFDLTRQ